MKKIFTLILSVLLLAGCNNAKRQYESIVKTLDLTKPIALENIKKAHLMITEANEFTPEQAIDLQERFTSYIGVCAQKEAEQIEEKYNTILSSDDSEHIEAQIDSLNKSVEPLREYGIIIYSAEGYIESEIMPMYVAELFWKYLSEAERDLAKLAELEVEDPSLQDASITISYQELGDRLKMCDDMAYKFPKDELYPQIVACQKFYLALLLAGADNSATFDWKTKKLNPEVRQTVINYIAEHPDAESTKTLKEFMVIMKRNNYQSSSESDVFLLNKISTEE